MTIQVTDASFEREVLQADRPVLIDFYADWCGPCKMLAPTIEQIAAEQAGIKVCKVNIDQQKALAQRFQIMSIPTLVVMQGGKVISTATGYRAKQDILAMLPKEPERRPHVAG